MADIGRLGSSTKQTSEGYDKMLLFDKARDWLDNETTQDQFSLGTTLNSNQLDTFYNSLNSNDQDALDSAAGGNFLDKMPNRRFSDYRKARSKSSLLKKSCYDSRLQVQCTLPTTIPFTNPRNEAKAITTRSGVSYEGSSIPMPPPFVNPDVVEETSMDPVPPPLTQKILLSRDFTDEFTLINSLPRGDDVSNQQTLNPFFDSFKSSNVNPLFEENNKDAEIKSSSSFTFTSPEVSELEAYLEKDSIPPGIDLSLPPTLEVSSSNPTSPTLTGEKVCSWKTPMFFSLIRFVWKMMTRIAIRKKIICLLATYLHQKPKLLSRPQEIEEIKEKEDNVSSDVPIDTIVMPIRITFDNPIDFNDHFSKPKDLKKDLTISFDSTTESSILPSPLLDSDSPFTAELSASVTLNSLGNEDKVFKPGILVYHTIHDKNLVTLEENLKENISSGTLLVFKEPSILLPTPEPPDECLKNVEDTFAFIIWTFLPFFTYTKASPMIFSFRSENFIFDPGIITFHNPVAVLMKVSICSP
ncbi:hypothetical protein Tco_0210224 [Tanacetum coccineum]